MYSQVEIVNAALTLLGEGRIISVDDDIKAAREAKALYDIARDSALAAHNWSFAKTRAALSALTTVPAFGYGISYQLPSDCLRLITVGEYYVGSDLTDFRGSDTSEFTIEGRTILTDLPAPLNIRYVKRVTDTTQFASTFAMYFAGSLAEMLCEAITQSKSKRDDAANFKKEWLKNAIRANAIELPPTHLADDEWILARL